MSWSLNVTGTKAEVRTAIANTYASPAIKGYLLDAVDKYPETRQISLAGYGHTYDGNPGNFNVTSGHLEVRLLAELSMVLVPEPDPECEAGVAHWDAPKV